MYTETNRTVEVKIVLEFINDIIEEAMKRFQISFEVVSEILEQLGYWEIFTDIETTLVGAHEGIEPILKEIEPELSRFEEKPINMKYTETRDRILEWFQEITGYDDDKFWEYIHKNWILSLLNNPHLLNGCMWAEAEDILNLFGVFIPVEERERMLKDYNSKLPKEEP